MILWLLLWYVVDDLVMWEFYWDCWLKMSFKREGLNLFFCTAVWYFEHNSLGFENLTMGLDVLESLFYGLTVWCFEFLHLKGRKIVNRV